MNEVSTSRLSTSEGIVGLFLALRKHGISEPALLKGIEASPREQFIPVEFHDIAWQPVTLPIPCGQTIIPAETALRMINALALEPSHAVLELGTGTGFQTALLARLSKKVISVERYQTLIDAALERIQRLDIQNVQIQQSNALELSAGAGLYDRIITDLAFTDVPRYLLDLLTSNGVLVGAIGQPDEEQMVVRLTKIGSRFDREDLFPARFSSFEVGLPKTL